MSNIVEFRLNPARCRDAVSEQDAEIVIFPGVRIERREFNLRDRIATSAGSSLSHDTRASDEAGVI